MQYESIAVTLGLCNSTENISITHIYWRDIFLKSLL